MLEKIKAFFGFHEVVPVTAYSLTAEGVTESELVPYKTEPTKTVPSKKTKYKVSYYEAVPNNKRYPNESSSFFKVSHRTDNNGLVTVKVDYMVSLIPVPSVVVSGDEDCDITMRFSDGETLVVGAHEAHDLALALMKYHELKSVANFKKVKKEKVNV